MELSQTTSTRQDYLLWPLFPYGAATAAHDPHLCQSTRDTGFDVEDEAGVQCKIDNKGAAPYLTSDRSTGIKRDAKWDKSIKFSNSQMLSAMPSV